MVGTMSRPLEEPEETQCLRAYVEVNGVKAYTLFDTGSTIEAMSHDFSRVGKVPLYVLENPATLKLGCVGSKSKVNYGTKVRTKFAQKESTVYFDVANIDQYDIILGIPYMNKHGIVLDIPAKEIIVDGKVRIPALPTVRKQVTNEVRKSSFKKGETV